MIQHLEKITLIVISLPRKIKYSDYMLKGILSVSGQPGLFKLIAEAKNRIIVESLLTGKRMPVGTTTKISSLEDIALYTNSGDLPLRDVLKKISQHEQGGQTIDSKSADQEIKKYFGTVIPDYDRDKVYVSDIRKVLLWYNILQEKELLVFEETEEAKEKEEEVAEGDAEQAAEKTPSE
jgi:hypothetical protein